MSDISELLHEIKKIKEKMLNLEERISHLEKQPDIKSKTNEIPKKIIEKIDKISTKNLVMISLGIKPKQSFKEMKEKIQKIGWVKDTFFEKNFATTLIKKGLVQPDGKDSEGKDMYSLTMKGEIESEKLLKKYIE